MTLRRNPLAFGLIYMALSIAVEIVLLLVFRLRIPRDNAILASVLLTVSPPAAAWICGYRRPAAFLLAAGGAVLLTLVLVVGFGRLTGISAGLGPPVALRTLAGLLAALLANVMPQSRGAISGSAGVPPARVRARCPRPGLQSPPRD